MLSWSQSCVLLPDLLPQLLPWQLPPMNHLYHTCSYIATGVGKKYFGWCLTRWGYNGCVPYPVNVVPNIGYASINVMISRSALNEVEEIAAYYNVGHSTMMRRLWSAGLTILLVQRMGGQYAALCPFLKGVEAMEQGGLKQGFQVLEKELRMMRRYCDRTGKTVAQCNRVALGYGVAFYRLRMGLGVEIPY